MTKLRTAVVAAMVLVAGSTAVLAQDFPALPAICGSAAAPTAGHGGMDHAMDEAHTDLMDEMDQMNAQMMTGGMADDIDVAFVCGMIPHHRGAIAMAQAELKHGDDPTARALAEKIIAAQEVEIAEMIAWLEQQ